MAKLIDHLLHYVLSIDALTAELVLELRSPIVTNAMTSVTGLGSVAAGLVFLGLFYLAGWRDEFFRTLIALALAGAVVALLMATVQRPFPPQPVCVTDGVGTPTTSFPSGHAAAVTAYAVVARDSETLPFKTISALAVVVAFSRIYLGVHYVSDTVVGMLLGVVSVLVAEWILDHLDTESLASKLSL